MNLQRDLAKMSLLSFLLVLFCASSMTYVEATPEEVKPLIFKNVEFGSITINGTVYEKDVVIDEGEIRQRKKGPSKEFRGTYGHTPLTQFEKIPWDCDTLVIGIGMSSRLPVTDGFKKEAKKRDVTLIMLATPEAVKYLEENYGERMNAILHITC
jgi:hypothetical protein